jgi:hypothetical protein
MNRSEFLAKFKELFSDYNSAMLEAYYVILDDPSGTSIDYKKLYNILISEYKYKTAPMPAWFAENSNKVRYYSATYTGEGLIDRQLKSGKAKIIAQDNHEGWYDIETPHGVCRFYDPVVNNAYIARTA